MLFLMRMSQLLLPIMFMACASTVMATGAYVVNQDGTISDPQHGTMWQKGDDSVERSWQEAVTYCDELELAGYKDWMLPKAYQLEGLIDTAFSPTIDPMFTVKASYYWSATASEKVTDSAKYVNFFYGNTYPDNKNNPYYVLCVRELTASPGKVLSAVLAGSPVRDNPLAIFFSATITGGNEPYFYEWDFGDGSTSSAAKPTHEFKKEGPYKVLLTVSDNDGAIAVANQDINLPLAEISAPQQDQDEAARPGIETKEKVPVLAESVPPASGPIIKLVGDSKSTGELGAGANTSTASKSTEGGQDNTTSNISLIAPGTAKLLGFMEVSASGQGVPHKDGVLGHGLLAYSFANAMAGDGDWNKDGSITSGEVQAYLDQAIKSLSNGKQTPAVTKSGDEFPVCAPHGGSTYVVTIGINHDLVGTPLIAGQDAELLRKAVENKCPITKTMMLTADHANRQDILNALVQVGSMITASDTLLFYVGASSGLNNGRLNWYINDSQKEIPTLTGIYHDELMQVLKTMPMGYLMVLGEKN